MSAALDDLALRIHAHPETAYEERFAAAGPLIKHEPVRDYPQDLKPAGEPTKYPSSGAPGENAFGLTKPVVRPQDKPLLPAPKFAEDAEK